MTVPEIVEKCMQNPDFRGMAMRYLSDPNDAEDALQDCALKALAKMPADHENPEAWFGHNLKFECLNLLRAKRKHAHAPADAIDPAYEPDIAQLLTDREAMKALNPRQYGTLCAKASGFTQREIATALNWPQVKVNRQINRGRNRLRKLVKS